MNRPIAPRPNIKSELELRALRRIAQKAHARSSLKARIWHWLTKPLWS